MLKKIKFPIILVYLMRTYEGVGLTTSKKILNFFKIGFSARLGMIPKVLELKLFNFMKLNYSVNRRFLRAKRLNYFSSIRYMDGLRFKLNLPIHSKRTKTNAKTRKKWRVH